jgi:hypothetical protein
MQYAACDTKAQSASNTSAIVACLYACGDERRVPGPYPRLIGDNVKDTVLQITSVRHCAGTEKVAAFDLKIINREVQTHPRSAWATSDSEYILCHATQFCPTALKL